jgi:hypothetical protein
MADQIIIESAQPRAQSALALSPIFDLRTLVVEEFEGGLVLTGSVSSYYHKQLAQEAVRAVAGGVPVLNSVRVGNCR